LDPCSKSSPRRTCDVSSCPRPLPLILVFCFVVLTVLWDSSCSRFVSPGPYVMPQNQADLLLDTVLRQTRSVTNVISEAKLTLSLGDKVYRARAVVALSRPDRFRVEILGPFGTPRSIVAYDGDKITASGSSQDVWLRAADKSREPRMWLGLTPRWLVSAALGLPPVDANSVSSVKAVRYKRHRLLLQLVTNDGRALALVQRSGQRANVEKFVFFPSAGQPILEVSYDNFSQLRSGETESVSFARAVQISCPQTKETLRIRYIRPRFNQELGKERFVVANQRPGRQR